MILKWSRRGMRAHRLSFYLTVCWICIALVPLNLGRSNPQAQTFLDIQEEARVLARSKGLESLRTAITNDATGQPLLLNPGKVPLPDLSGYLNDQNPDARKVAAQLGKALFWEQAVGSDGQACASCHFHAGADNRIKNQLDPAVIRIENDRRNDIEGFHFALPDQDLKYQLVGGGLGPNYIFKAEDFPFVKDIGAGSLNGRNVILDGSTVVPSPPNSNDIASSQGVFWTRFQSVLEANVYDPYALRSFPVSIRDKGEPLPDPLGFLVSARFGAFDGKVNVRRVEPRNTPTMINAVFNLHNFWDGRANFFFNGVNPFGQTDPDAQIFVKHGAGLEPETLAIDFSSLASQAVGPPLSNFEMSFDGRIWPDIGKKMLTRKLLAQQAVHPDDSLLGELLATFGAAGSRGGIQVEYQELIKSAFHPDLWSDTEHRVIFPDASVTSLRANSPLFEQRGYEIIDLQTALDRIASGELTQEQVFAQMEANFSFFFGIAVMLYQAELVADQSKFDKWMEGKDTLTEQEILGLLVFVGGQIQDSGFAQVTDGKCVNCHGGPEFTNASVRNTQAGANFIEPMLMGDNLAAFYDNGFYNISVTPTPDDSGRGGKGPGDRPLSSSRQFLFKNQGIDGPIDFPVIGLPVRNLQPVPGTDPPVLRAVAEGVDVCVDLDGNEVCDENDKILIQRVAVDGAFKTPQLRNVELTGPYFHNGSALTLMQVVRFYNAGGNFCKFNFDDLDPDIQRLGLSEQEREGLVAFQLTLTDERVRLKQSPFDHPELRIPNGHPGNHTRTQADCQFARKQARDNPITLCAVGSEGVPPKKGLQPFHVRLGVADHSFIGTPVENTPCQRPNPANQPPNAVDDGPMPVNVNGSIDIDVLQNDSDPDGSLDPASVEIKGMAGGTAVANGDGTVTFTAGNAPGSASFRYTVKDNFGAESNEATVTINIQAVVEQINVTRATYSLIRRELRVQGTTNVPGPGNFMTIHNGPDLSAAVVDTVEADASGNWSFRGSVTLNRQRIISVQSTGGASVLSVPVDQTFW